MKHKKLFSVIALTLLISSASAIEVLDINIEEPDGTQPVVGDLVDINATVDGQGDITESVRYSVYENDTALKESVLMSFDGGDTKQISYWFESDTYELKNNSVYEISVVGVNKKGTSDELLITLNTTGTSVKAELEETTEIDQGIFATFLRQFGLNEGFWGQGLSDISLGEILILLFGAYFVIWIFG